jgi:hypothetical protein
MIFSILIFASANAEDLSSPNNNASYDSTNPFLSSTTQDTITATIEEPSSFLYTEDPLSFQVQTSDSFSEIKDVKFIESNELGYKSEVTFSDDSIMDFEMRIIPNVVNIISKEDIDRAKNIKSPIFHLETDNTVTEEIIHSETRFFIPYEAFSKNVVDQFKKQVIASQSSSQLEDKLNGEKISSIIFDSNILTTIINNDATDSNFESLSYNQISTGPTISSSSPKQPTGKLSPSTISDEKFNELYQKVEKGRTGFEGVVGVIYQSYNKDPIIKYLIIEGSNIELAENIFGKMMKVFDILGYTKDILEIKEMFSKAEKCMTEQGKIKLDDPLDRKETIKQLRQIKTDTYRMLVAYIMWDQLKGIDYLGGPIAEWTIFAIPTLYVEYVKDNIMKDSEEWTKKWSWCEKPELPEATCPPNQYYDGNFQVCELICVKLQIEYERLHCPNRGINDYCDIPAIGECSAKYIRPQ